MIYDNGEAVRYEIILVHYYHFLRYFSCGGAIDAAYQNMNANIMENAHGPG
jgi:hypothetical protein